jgi:hypothetical protein
MSSCLEGGGGLQMITNFELINFPVVNPYCQYLEEHFQFSYIFFLTEHPKGCAKFAPFWMKKKYLRTPWKMRKTSKKSLIFKGSK